MKKVTIVAVLMGLLSLFCVSFANPAAAGAAHCNTALDFEKIYIDGKLNQLKGVATQTCVGTYAWFQTKPMIQKKIVRKNWVDSWQTMAQNQIRSYPPKFSESVPVRKFCNTRAPSREFRLVGSFTNQLPSGKPGGVSHIHPTILKAKC